MWRASLIRAAAVRIFPVPESREVWRSRNWRGIGARIRSLGIFSVSAPGVPRQAARGQLTNAESPGVSYGWVSAGVGSPPG